MFYTLFYYFIKNLALCMLISQITFYLEIMTVFFTFVLLCTLLSISSIHHNY